MVNKISEIIGNREEIVRIMVMGATLLLAAVMTFWFHGVLRYDAVFTHLFYVPIIMASIWWQRKGLFVALSLAAVLIVSDIQYNIYILNYNDYFRAVIFILVASVVAGLSEKISNSEVALRESEERYRNIFNNAQVGMFRSAIRDGTILEANQRIADILGFESPKEMMQVYKTLDYYVDPGRRKGILDEGRETGLFNGDEVAIRRNDGSVIFVHYSGRIYTEAGYIEGVMIDITQQKLVEDRLRKSEEKYRNLFHNAQVGAAWSVLEDGRIVDANRRLAEMYGYTSIQTFKDEFIISKHYVDPGVRAQFLAELEKEGRIKNFEARHRRRDGEIIWVRYSCRLDPGRHLVETVVVDVTQAKLAEAALKESEEKYRNIFENAQVGIARSRISDGRVLEANRKAAEIAGYDSVATLKKQHLFSGKYADKGAREVFMSEILSKGRIDNFETRIIRSDGEIIWVRYSGRAYPDKGYLEGMVVDITAEKAARDALLKSKKALKRINRQLLTEGRKRRHLSKRLIDLLEKDRKRISMDLHDQVGQDLTKLKIDLEMLLRNFGPNEVSLGVKINAVRDKTVKAIRDIKEISSGLRPSVLDHLGLVPALKELCDIMNQQTGLRIYFFCKKKFWDLGVEREVAIYRIVQEGLTNMVKHSGARKGFVSLTWKEGMVSVSIEDDGLGFEKRGDHGFHMWSKELGLLIMEERAMQLGGSFRVESSVGVGTTLLAEIPL